MGSATTQAVAATTAALNAASSVDLSVAGELFAAARILSASPQLRGALADSSAAAQLRTAVVRDVFGTALSAPAIGLLDAAVSQAWSSEDDLVDGLEELAVRAATQADPAADVDGELFEFSRIVAANPELELGLGSRVGASEKKGELVESLLRGRASEATTLIAASLIREPRERRVRELLAWAMRLAAAQHGRTVATVYSAAPLSAAQSERLSNALAAKYDTQVSLNSVIDPTVVGGLRVQVADDVIDATVSARLADLRRRLAG
ncbi:F0F1 ATP synthase subunit delta [Microbacterium rhizosphaerae]|jgi:F-type H+-transporting ATPase subunit delta|uniref:ATP synthase subunit delta n=1 Tax=Microbacterium rhizosphaerae TaxID=1678237 RepID=A0ABZ0SRY1_9MICO|nr:F0F1 ATP synthase subunit delta [Microbacterium rhizosphaerae]WPR90994.1 F0F1 ATP synthase subunit delta [Microbacterium rhizosphaerae]